MKSITFIAIGIMIGIIISKLFFKKITITKESEPTKPRKRKSINKPTNKKKYQAIVAAKLPATSLLNEEEKIIFKIISDFISKWNNNPENSEEARGLICLSQVSLGEFIAPSSRQDQWTYNEKIAWFTLQGRRADFLIIDKHSNPILVIEHQGSGHFQGDWKNRDKTKKTAYGYAGISIAETTVNDLKNPRNVWGMIANKLKKKYNINYNQ